MCMGRCVCVLVCDLGVEGMRRKREREIEEDIDMRLRVRGYLAGCVAYVGLCVCLCVIWM